MDSTKRTDNLFNEFPPVSSREWMDKITEDLKGNHFGKIIWDTGEGVNINPFYRTEDILDKEYLSALPGSFPFVRSGKKYLNDWDVRQEIEVTNYAEANKNALHALNKGASSISFSIAESMTCSPDDFRTLLHDIFFDCINLNFNTPGKETDIPELLRGLVDEQTMDPTRIKGSINYDPIGNLSINGNFKLSEEEDFKTGAFLIRDSSEKIPNLRVTGINGILFHNAGASIVQELAFSLACASEYLSRYNDFDLGIDKIARSLQLNIGTGPLFFLEVAKIRATRLLFARLIDAWKPLDKESCRIFIHSETSTWNQTIFDPYVNMLRGTTEGMAAALGGADSITISPFDNSFRETTDFSERIARNVHVILKEEAYIDKVIDPAAGSYYIENITDSIAARAWEMFVEIEENGGIVKALKNGQIQDMINETARKRDMNIATRKDILLGTNHYPDPTERFMEDLNFDIAFPRKTSEGLIVKPITPYRGAMGFEELRLNILKNKDGKPKVFLLPFGNVNWRVARVNFASGFFGCAGFEILENNAFETIQEGIEKAIQEKASIVVLCSSDDQYPLIAPEAMKLLESKAILVIAGNPKDAIDELKSKGIEHFIHIKSNVLEELKLISGQ